MKSITRPMLTAASAFLLALALCGVGSSPSMGAAGLSFDIVITNTTGVFSTIDDHNVYFPGILGSPGSDTISMDIYVMVSGTNSIADEGFKSMVTGRIRSTNLANTTAGGVVRGTMVSSRFGANWSSGAAATNGASVFDLDGDGDLDIGDSSATASNSKQFAPRASSVVTSADAGTYGVTTYTDTDTGNPGVKMKIGSVVFTATALPASPALNDTTKIVLTNQDPAGISASAAFRVDGATVSGSNTTYMEGKTFTNPNPVVIGGIGSVLTWNPPGNTWNTSGTNTDWLNVSSVAAAFVTGSVVNFTDTGVGAVSIDPGGIIPAIVNVSNTTGTYTFQDGPINGFGTTLIKTNAGTLILAHSNGFTGSVNIQGGVINVRDSAGLGSIAAGTTVNSGAALELQGGIAIAGEALFLNGTGISGGGALRNISDNNSWAGTISLITDSSISADADSLTISGALDNSAGKALAKSGAGTLIFSGNQTWGNNSSLTVSNGTVRYNLDGSKTVSVGTGVTATVDPGATLELSGSKSALGSLAGNRANITNNSTSTLHVTGTSQIVGTITGVGNTTLDSNTDLTAKQIQQNNLTINGSAGNPNARVTIDNDGTTPNPNPVLNTLTSLTMANDNAAWTYASPRNYYSTLDLKDNNLVIRAPSGTGTTVWQNDVLPAVVAGFNLGAFGNKAITSSTAQSTGNTVLAAAINNDGFGNPLFANGSDLGIATGQTEFLSLGAMSIDDIIIRYTYYGDFTLDGVVDGFDQVMLDVHFGESGVGWVFGDSNYDGVVDAFDQAILDTFFGSGDGGLGGAPLGGSGGLTTVPEPATLSLLTLAGLSLLRRTRSR